MTGTIAQRPSIADLMARLPKEGDTTEYAPRIIRDAKRNRIRAVAINALMEIMALDNRSRFTDDDAARVEMAERLLTLPDYSPADAKIAGADLVPEQQQSPVVSAVAQAAVSDALDNGAAA